MAGGAGQGEADRQLQKEFADELPGVGFNFSQYIQDNVEEALSGVKGANSVKIVGPNLDKLEELAAQIQAEMRKVRGVADLGIFHVLGQPNLNIKINRAKGARYGLNAGDVNTVIQAALGGAAATTLLEGDRQFGVRCACSARTATTSSDQLDQGRLCHGMPVSRLCAAERSRRHLARHRRLLYLSRPQPALYSDQILGARPRSRRNGRRGARARRQGDQAARPAITSSGPANSRIWRRPSGD